MPSGISGIFLLGFFEGCFLLHYWLANLSMGPLRALAIKYVMSPFYVTHVVERVY